MGGGVLRFPAPGGRKEKKGPAQIKMKDGAREDGSLYYVLQRRIADIHNSGRANTCDNLLKYITGDPDGPGLQDVRHRVSRRKLDQMRFIQNRKRELIAAERPKPHVIRWWASYCIRRMGGIAGELPRRPRRRMQPISIRTRQIAIPGKRPESNTATWWATSGRVVRA